MTDHTAAIPPAVLAAYPDLTSDQHPTIAQVFTPGRGWQPLGAMHKHISPAYARTLQTEGVTAVSLRINGQFADFTVAELQRRTAPPPRDRIIAAVTDAGRDGITPSKVARKTGTDSNTAAMELRQLAADGAVDHDDRGAWTRYYPNR